jgi:hypothetical protein
MRNAATRRGSNHNSHPLGLALEAHEAAQLAIATSWEALHRGHGILSISEMSRLSGESRQDIYRIFNQGAVNGS